MEDIYIEIGARILYNRKVQKVTQEQLAEIIGVKRTSIVQFEKGSQKISIDKLYLIAKALKIGIRELLPDVDTTLSDEYQLDEHSEDRVDIKSRDDIIKILETLKSENLLL